MVSFDVESLFTTYRWRSVSTWRLTTSPRAWDGMAIGFPLAPVFANLFTGHHERIWLENYKASSILFYRRYVDDTFCLFDTEHDATLLFDYINDRHPNIRFTMKKEIKKSPFWMF